MEDEHCSWKPAVACFLFDGLYLFCTYLFEREISVFTLNTFVWLPTSVILVGGLIISLKRNPLTAHYVTGAMPCCILSPLLFCHVCGIIFMRDVYQPNEAYFLLFFSSLGYMWFMFLYYKFFIQECGMLMLLQLGAGVIFGLVGGSCAITQSCTKPLLATQVVELFFLTTSYKIVWALQTKALLERETENTFGELQTGFL